MMKREKIYRGHGWLGFLAAAVGRRGGAGARGKGRGEPASWDGGPSGGKGRWKDFLVGDVDGGEREVVLVSLWGEAPKLFPFLVPAFVWGTTQRERRLC